MSLEIRKLGFVLIAFICFAAVLPAQVRVMPLGNSITYDNNSLDTQNPRPVGDRISYRYKLYQLLNDEDYDFDYVGSEFSGNNYFQDAEYDDNAGFPGIDSEQLAHLIKTGYNQKTGETVSSGPYLVDYPADIILLHIGTNNLITSARDVEDVLDNIRTYASDSYVLVAKIINRQTYSLNTSIFNENVETMVEQRNDPRIVMVDMEEHAGINYTYDMIDNLHPNAVGYEKMAYEWFDALQSLNEAPVVDQIPEQYTNRDEDFDPVFLDNFVEDAEDPDHQLTWTFTQQLGSQLIVSIDANRILRVSPKTAWSGSEVLTLEVKDSGGDVFPRTTKMLVDFTVKKGNDPPVIISLPLIEVNQEDEYSYFVDAVDVDGDDIIYSVPLKPSWLTFDQESKILSGTPHDEHVGFHDVILRVADDENYSEQSYTVEVINVNDAPYFTSTPQLTTEADVQYSYVIYATDPDGDPVEYDALVVPDWLTYDAQARVLVGVPDIGDIGDWEVSLQVSDEVLSSTQDFTIEVINGNKPPEFLSTPPLETLQDNLYYYGVIIRDTDGDNMQLSGEEVPSWLTLDPVARTLSGTPTNNEIGSYQVALLVSDGYDSTRQVYELVVNNVNDPPVFTSDPITECRAQQAYVYKVEAEDIDPDDQLTISALVKPDWLSLSTGVNEALLFGTPDYSMIGSHGVILSLSDGGDKVLQVFNISVGYPVSNEGSPGKEELVVYPNPSDGLFYFQFDNPEDCLVKVFDSSGTLRRTFSKYHGTLLELNISDFERGIYFYELTSNGVRKTGKLIKH